MISIEQGTGELTMEPLRSLSKMKGSDPELGTYGIFQFNFFNNIKLIFAFFIKLIYLGVAFLHRTGEEIGY